MKMIKVLSSRHPQKNYGEYAWGDLVATILATDYKSPPYGL